MNDQTVKSLRRVIRKLRAEAALYRSMASLSGIRSDSCDAWSFGESALLMAVEEIKKEIRRQESDNVR